jgi:hypothetical protein
MQYTILIYQTAEDMAHSNDPDPARAAVYAQEWPRYAKALKDAGVLVEGIGLQPPAMATRVSFPGGKELVQDGPYADTKEQLGGFIVIDVPDLDTALSWVARIPRLENRVFEVRPNKVLPS